MYKKRIADKLLAQQLQAMGAVLIQGPKWCGKTTTAQQQAKSILFMDDPSQLKQNLILAESEPALLLEGETPRLIDEWQLAPQLWDAARFVVDRRSKPGQFIFTGSAVPPDRSKITHSGAGRFGWVTMRTMSLWESGDSNGSLSMLSLFEQPTISSSLALGHSLLDIAFLVCRGGWPAALSLPREASLLLPRNYIDAVANSDISKVDGVSRDPRLTARLLRSYARHQGTAASLTKMNNDLTQLEEATTSNTTISSYLQALREIFVVEDMPAWSPNLRSKTAIQSSDVRYFTDPSIAVAALGLGPKDLISDLNTFGLLFETMVVRDLRVYAEALDGELFHYRDKSGLECDAVLHRRNGTYGLIEIKIGGDTLIEQGATTLKKLAEKIDTDKMPPPSFLMVITATGDYCYQRPDGVLVAPIGALKD